MAGAIEVLHDQSGSRFCVKLEGYEACLMCRLAGDEIDLYHTYVPEVFRGRGVAEKLCQAAFEYAKANQLTSLTKRGGPTSNPLVSG